MVLAREGFHCATVCSLTSIHIRSSESVLELVYGICIKELSKSVLVFCLFVFFLLVNLCE